MIKLEKLKEELTKEEVSPEEKIVDIHYDSKRQIYTIRLPVAFAKAVNLNETDKFKFFLVKEYSKERNEIKIKLKGEVVDEKA